MKRIMKTRRSRIMGAVMGFVLSASLVAVAAWLITSTGDGATRVGQLVAPTTLPISTEDTGGGVHLFPGQSGSLYVKASNPNDVDLYITATSGGSANGNTSCLGTNFTVNPLTGVRIGPFTANATTVVDLPDGVSLSATAPSDCQASVFTVSGVTFTWST